MPGLSSAASRVGLAVFTYDFDVDGGDIGTIIIGAGRIPSGAIILDGIVHVATACTSGGSATVAIHIASSEDILAATAVASLTLNALLDAVADGTAANAIRCTSALGCSFVIATAALTAGKIIVGLRYIDTV